MISTLSCDGYLNRNFVKGNYAVLEKSVRLVYQTSSTANLRELAGEHTRGGGCGLIGFNAGNLTRGDSRVKVRLKSVPDKLRSGAWPSSVRVVRCPVKSGNEQDPRPMLPRHIRMPALMGDRWR